MRRGVLVIAALALWGVHYPRLPARAFSIGSGISQGCHERISAAAFLRFASQHASTLPGFQVDERWRRVVRLVAKAAGGSHLSDTQAFVLFSLVVGVRAPDTQGHSIAEIQSLRSVHADPDPKGQYAHAIRALNDDYFEGDIGALQGTRAAIRAAMHRVGEALRLPASRQLG